MTNEQLMQWTLEKIITAIIENKHDYAENLIDEVASLAEIALKKVKKNKKNKAPKVK